MFIRLDSVSWSCGGPLSVTCCMLANIVELNWVTLSFQTEKSQGISIRDQMLFLIFGFFWWWNFVFWFSAPGFFFFFSFIFISWRLITLQYYSDFCHTLTWISHGFTCVPHPDPPALLPPHPIPLGLPSAPALSTCLMYPSWAGDLFHAW